MKVKFTWDPWKSEWNLKHRYFSFEYAEQVFYDTHVRFKEDRVDAEGRERIHAVGMVEGRVYLVVFVEETDEQEIRYHIISARLAEPREERFYFEGD